MNIDPTNLLESIAANINNKKLTDRDFRQMVNNTLKDHQESQAVIKRLKEDQSKEIIDTSIPMSHPLLHSEDASISIIYTHEQSLMNNVKRTLDVYENGADKTSIIMDLTGFEDAESEEFDTLVTLFGYDNAEKIAGRKIELIFLN